MATGGLSQRKPAILSYDRPLARVSFLDRTNRLDGGDRPEPIRQVSYACHRFIQKRIVAGLGFRSAEGGWRTIEGYEVMHAIRKGQIRWLAKGDATGQRKFMHAQFGTAA